MKMQEEQVNILVVDDEQGIRITLAGILEEEGYNVVVAETGTRVLYTGEYVLQLTVDVTTSGTSDGVKILVCDDDNTEDCGTLDLDGLFLYWASLVKQSGPFGLRDIVSINSTDEVYSGIFYPGKFNALTDGDNPYGEGASGEGSNPAISLIYELAVVDQATNSRFGNDPADLFSANDIIANKIRYKHFAADGSYALREDGWKLSFFQANSSDDDGDVYDAGYTETVTGRTYFDEDVWFTYFWLLKKTLI